MIAATIAVKAILTIFVAGATTSAVVNIKEPAINQYLYRPDSHQTGPAKAKTRVTTFVNYQCKPCHEQEKVIKATIAQNPQDINVTVRHYPFEHYANSRPAARAAEAAGMQNKFWEMHTLLLQNQNEWIDSGNPQPFFEKYAQDLDLSIDKFRQDLNDPKIDQQISQDAADAQTLKVDSLPTVFIDGKNQGYVTSADQLQNQIDLIEELEKDWFEYTLARISEELEFNRGLFLFLLVLFPGAYALISRVFDKMQEEAKKQREKAIRDYEQRRKNRP